MNYAFAVAALDRCADRRECEAELAQWLAHADSRWLCLGADGRAPVLDGGRLALIGPDELPARPTEWIFLGRQDGRMLFVCLAAPEPQPVAGRWLDLRSAATLLAPHQAGLLAYARALCVWRQNHRHCGRCGAVHQVEAGGHRLRCPVCEAVSFPRTDPVIIVAVSDGDRCLLGRQASWPAGRYSTLAGFVEPGETLETAVAREVQEEAGISVTDCRYLGSQPWPFPASLMLAFEARAETTEIRLGDELEDARWFDPDEIDRALAGRELGLASRYSIAYWLIERWYQRTTGRALPSVPPRVG